ncbi:MAG: MBOAT family protein [Bacteroidetes bacterium]|nr:MBOAT family protein [Bacteroidota bacterium]MBS1633207.1 MBOAT family protein [Bacteroidota bacterium]
MLFNSFEFFIFFPLVFILYWFVFSKNLPWQNRLLLVASYFFYGWWSWEFMLLLFISTLLDYTYGFWVASPNRKKAKLFLWLSVINNLGILAVFKYYNFFIEQFTQGLDLIGFHTNPVFLKVALPVGISFYTFHGMSYVFDIYRGKQKPVKNFVDYAVFVSFFPLLVAGPIERANHLLPQVQQKRIFSYTQAVEGCRLVLWGLFKKIVIADSLAPIVDELFTNYHQYSSFSLLLGVIAFSFQIYGDFSGYTDIALGAAKLLGIELLSNFKFPYFSRNVAEFWKRWHISLSTWFRDYLYIPLGGSKEGRGKAVRNTFIIFLVSGFWHGASWNFILWGFIHACGFIPLFLLNQSRKYYALVVAHERKLPYVRELMLMVTTFAFVSFAWIFFRASTIGDAWGYVGQLFSNQTPSSGKFLKVPGTGIVLAYISSLLFVDWRLRRDERKLKFSNNRNINYIFYFLLFAITLCYFIIQVVMKNKTNFIYFQF